MDNYNLGLRIHDLRTEKNMTQEMVAEHMNVSRQTIAKWETNKSKPSTNNLIMLAKFFDIPLNELTLTPSRDIDMHNEKKYRLFLFVPIIIYSGTCILHSFGQGDSFLQMLSLIIIFMMAILMSVGIWKLDSDIRLRYAKKQLLFCFVSWFATFILVRYIGNILTMILTLFIATSWIKAIGGAIEAKA